MNTHRVFDAVIQRYVDRRSCSRQAGLIMIRIVLSRQVISSYCSPAPIPVTVSGRKASRVRYSRLASPGDRLRLAWKRQKQANVVSPDGGSQPYDTT